VHCIARIAFWDQLLGRHRIQWGNTRRAEREVHVKSKEEDLVKDSRMREGVDEN